MQRAQRERKEKIIGQEIEIPLRWALLLSGFAVNLLTKSVDRAGLAWYTNCLVLPIIEYSK